MKRPKTLEDLLQILGLFSLIFFGFYFVFTSVNKSSFKETNKDNVDLLVLDRQVDDAINKSMRGVYSKKKLRDLEVNSKKSEISEKFYTQSKNWAPDSHQDEFKSSNNNEIYLEDTSTSEVSMSSLNVENHLRSNLNQNRDRLEQIQRDKAEYKRQFIENAKKDGWIVELDDNLNVISAKEK